jgi:hypothetical protein
MDTQPVPSDNGGGPPTLAQPGIVRVVCRTCAYTWTGPAAEQPAGCPHDGRELVVTAATGETIEQAITAAAQELPERTERTGPVQQTLPGTRPMFDLAGALTMIEDAAQEARVAEAAYEGAKAHAKRRREEADQANTTLRDLIRDLAKRRHDARYEPKDTDDHTQPARETGSPVGGDMGAAGAASLSPDGGDSAAVSNVPADGASADNAPLSGENDEALFTSDEPPTDAPLTYEELAEDASNAATLALLHRAGADQITREAVDAWTEAQYTAARAWALEQIEAHANDAHGKQTSVQWPAHVSLAQHGPPTHTPKKRAKKQTTRRRAR